MISFIIIIIIISFFIFTLLPVILLLSLIKKRDYIELTEGQRYAGFWYRVLAGLIDLVILYIISFLIGFMIGFSLINNLYFDEYYFFMTWASNFISIIISFLYYVLFQMSKKQATPGMMVVGIKIYDEKLQRAGFWRLTGRYFATGLSNLILLIGCFMIGWTKRKQGLHDIFARTIHLKK